MFMVVVLPQPDGPSSAVNEPCGDVQLEILDGLHVAEVLRQVVERWILAIGYRLIAPKVRPRTR